MTDAPQVLPYGSWPSPIAAADVARGSVRLNFPQLVVDSAGTDAWWTEGRPAEGGRQVVVSQRRGDLLPAPWNARTRVHEYGGMSWLVVAGGAGLVFAEWGDQRLYYLDIETPDATPQPLTPQPEIPAGMRYADFTLSPDGTEVFCVRETHNADAAVSRAIVAVPLDGSAAADESCVRVVVAGSHFLAYPRPSADGRRLAWIAWEHPNMPWDSTELRVGDLIDGAVPSWRVVLGGTNESVLQPEWAADTSDRLYAISDRSGWWNLYEIAIRSDEAPRPLAERDEEFGGPLWEIGARFYAVLDDGRLLAKHARQLGVLDPASGDLRDLETPFTVWGALRTAGGSAVCVASGPSIPASIVLLDLSSGTYDILRCGVSDVPDAALLPEPRSEIFVGANGRDVHAQVYPPRNPYAVAPPDERPPYVVFVHGGPTASSPPTFHLDYAYFTSRGIGVVDVDYGGSAGYGREYRERLRGQWGVVDVEDCVAAAQALAEKGEADAARLAIRGGSAGGWTTLAALTRTNAFAAGTSFFGVAELLHFVKDTHDFESRYIDGLVGPLPEAQDLYVERAPLSHVDSVSCPVLLLQGLDDKVVPPSQAEMFRDALAAKGIPHAYLPFEGEQHGFRRAENVIAAMEAELSFYGQVFGFEPPGIPKLKMAAGA